jgi:dipeptidyl aminopeptidase/acylaminoacyl peptidase
MRKYAVYLLPFCLGIASAQLHIRPFLNLPGETSDPAISPDGKTLAFAWWTPKDDDWGLYTRPISGGEPKLFAKSEEGIAYSPKWSPDGKWIAFLRSGTPRTSELVVKAVSGNEERQLGPVCSDGVAWTTGSRHIIAPNNDDTDMLENCSLTVVP